MNDQSTVRIVIGVLGSLALAVVVGGIVLALNDKSLPGELIAIGSAAAGAVGGILSKTGTSEAQPVNVVNRSSDPVPVAAQEETVDIAARLRDVGLYDDEPTTRDRGAVAWGTVALVVIAVVAVLFAFGKLPLDL